MESTYGYADLSQEMIRDAGEGIQDMTDAGRRVEQANDPISVDSCAGIPRLLLMRHAQTHANAAGYFLGSRDEGVTEVGEEQSRRAVSGLVSWKPDRIVTSPLIRCRELIAEPAARELGIECTVDERIREFDFGPLEGRTYADIVREGLPFPWGPGAGAWPPTGGGERMEDFVARIADAAHDYEQLEGRTAVICHGGVIRGFFCVWFSMGADEINRLVVQNVNSFIFRSAPCNVSLERFGLLPESLGEYE